MESNVEEPKLEDFRKREFTRHLFAGSYFYKVSDIEDYFSNYVYNVFADAYFKAKEGVDIREYCTPAKIIFDNPYTTVFWQDGTFTTIKCLPQDKYSKEHGLAQAITRRLFKSRNAFLDIVESGVVYNNHPDEMVEEIQHVEPEPAEPVEPQLK